ncbi:MAG: flagellar hook-length control protein FliK [Lachnospiraceae bacterium]|nr:flagellar hook-length control protein FliK [Lachnospiraceae bacterium]
MVNAGIEKVSQPKLQMDVKNLSSGKTHQTKNDFTKILTEQSDKFNTSQEDRQPVSGNEAGEPDNVSGIKNTDIAKDTQNTEKSAEFKKLFQESTVSGEDTQSAEEAISCVLVQVDNFLTQITQMLSEQFDISMEEVSECMSELGMNVADLFDKQNILQLITQLTGQDSMSNLLVNQSLSETVMDIYALADELKESLMNELSMTEEEFDALLKEADTAILEGKDNIIVSDDEVYKTEVVNSDIVSASKDSEDFSETNEPILEENGVSDEKVIWKDETETLQDHSENTDSQGKMNRDDKKQNMDSYGTVISGNIIEGLKNAVDTSISVKESGISERIIARILDEIRLNIRTNATSLELQLEPESLGKVNIAVSTKAGVLTAQIAAQNEVAKEAIESQMSTLREAFEAQGLKVEEVEVTLASRSFEQEFDQSQDSGKNNQSKSRRHISKKELDEINGIVSDKEEMPLEDVQRELGSTVSYSA